MRKEHVRLRLCLLPLALLLVALLPASAGAATYTFLDTSDLYPTGGGGVVGPATQYPSSIVVSGLPGTVTKVTVTVLDYGSSSPDDTDMVIMGPNGQKVMLMSDVCGENPNTAENDDWTFDDSAQTFLSNNGPCANNQEASYKPSNYLGGAPEPDDLSPGGGPPPPYVNAMSFLAGASPNGVWRLFVTDDNGVGFVGFDIAGWALTLEVQSPTGQRAAALKKCKKKKTKKARRKCRKKASLLPL